MGRLLCTLAALVAFKSGECNQFCKYQGLESGSYSEPYCVCVKKVNYSELSKKRLGILQNFEEKEEPARPIFRLDDTFDFTD